MPDAPLFPEGMGAILGALLRPVPPLEQSGPPWVHTFNRTPPCDDEDCERSYCDGWRWSDCTAMRCGHLDEERCDFSPPAVPCPCSCHRTQATHTIAKAD
jgi:hypothetical protein